MTGRHPDINRVLAGTRDPLHALIADDDSGILLTLTALLEQKGHAVSAVGDGAAAVAALSTTDFGLILLDICMPELDGFDTCSTIRQLENGKNVPILMLTGQDDTESVRKAFEAGATDFVAKPINYALMSYRIDYILRAAGVAEELRKSQQRSRHAQRIANLGHIEWDTSRDIKHCSRGILEILKLPEQPGLSGFDDFVAYVHPEDRSRVVAAVEQALFQGSALNLEHRIVRSDGEVRFVLQITEARPNPGVLERMVVTLQDITDRIDIENRMHALAYYDDLTGLPNRSLLIQQLDQLLRGAARYEHSTAVIVFGVDRFDKVVEGLDHQESENLIKLIAERIKNTCRECDLLSRQSTEGAVDAGTGASQLTAKLRNDEYVIVLSAINSLQAASVFLQRLVEQFRHAFTISDRRIYLATSAGISLAPIDGDSSNQLIKFAEIARGFASQEGGGSFHYFKQELNQRVMRKFSLADDLRKALREDRLEVHYQPRIRLADNHLVSVEALCRWKHPEMGSIPPTEFIEIAEEEGLIGELGARVFETACNQLLDWRREFDCDFGISVNLSPDQLLDEEAMRRIFEFVSSSPIDNHLVEFELTESTLLANFDTSLSILNRCVDIGCGLAIDDFGTGYSSLSYLGNLPAKTLKIDKSFIHLIESSMQYTAIVGGIIKLAHSLGLVVVAEGVETALQRTILQQEQCDEIQGGLVGWPMHAQAFASWLDDFQQERSRPEYADNEGGVVRQWHSNYSAR